MAIKQGVVVGILGLIGIFSWIHPAMAQEAAEGALQKVPEISSERKGSAGKPQETADKPTSIPLQKEADKALQWGRGAVESVNRTMGRSRLNRLSNDHAIVVNYSLIDTWIPAKYGLAYSYFPSPESTWELDWNHSSLGVGALSVNFAEMTEDRISLMKKSFSKRNSFYWAYGLHYYRFQAHLGDKYLSQVTGQPGMSIDLLKVSSLGVSFALGNRWHFENWLIGFDWLSLHLPLVVLDTQSKYIDYASNENDRNTVRDTIDVIKSLPTFTALKFQVGYSF